MRKISFHSRSKPQTVSGWTLGEGTRLRLFFVFFLLIGAALTVRLYFLQVYGHDKWTALAGDQHFLFQDIIADRGEISIRDSEGTYPIAINREYETVYVVPKDVTEKDRTAIELSRVLSLDAGTIREKLDRPDDPFEIVKKRLSDDEVSRVKELRLRGVALLPEKYRYYPAGELASQVIGFASLDERGAGGYGIETSFDAALKGQDGRLSQEKDAAGRWIPFSDREVVGAKNGDSLVLTLDRVIQYETEKILKEALEKFRADRVTAIVMDPGTGNVLSMASLPQFDPNRYSEETDYSRFLNPAVSLSYEPGSVIKPITMAIGLEEGKVSPDTEYVDTGVVSIGGYHIRNSEDKVYGKSSMTKVLEESINTGVIYVEKLVGNTAFRNYFKRFGFGEKTGVQLPAELSGNIRHLEDTRRDIQFYTASFGQGITVTPLQLVTAYAALANGGRLMRPHLVSRVVHADGDVEDVRPETIRQVLSEETSRKIGKMLRNVVVNGHGKRADVPGYLVGGKTGTAQVAKSDAKGYEEGVSIGSFVGYAPIDDPKFVVLVKIDNPKDVEWAESSAAPTFGQIMKFLLEYSKVQPTEEVKKKPL